MQTTFTAADGTFPVEEMDAQLSSYFEGRSPSRTYAAYSVAELDTTGIEPASG